MAFKIYVDTVTKELVIENGIEYRYPAYSEIQRQKWGDYIVVRGRNGLRKFFSVKNGFRFLL